MIKNNTAEYAADIRSIISTVTTACYWQHAPETATGEYVVFDISDVLDSRSITINLWGTRGREIELADLADAVEAVLDGAIISNMWHTSSIVSSENKQWVADEDERIIHIYMSFDATYKA